MRRSRRALVAVLLVALVGLPVTPASANPSWWDSSYSHRLGITIQTVDALPNGYTIRFAIDHAALYAAGLAQGSGNDVRVVRWNGSTWAELDRVVAWGSYWNGSDTTLDFRTQTAISASTTDTGYYVYYGNPWAGAPPANKDNVYYLQDDFSGGALDTSKWNSNQTPANTTLNQTGGELVMTGNNMAPWDSVHVGRNSGSNPYDTTIEVTISMISQSATVWNESWLFPGTFSSTMQLRAAGSTSRTVIMETDWLDDTTLTSAQTFSGVRTKYFRAADGTTKYWENGSLVEIYQGSTNHTDDLQLGFGANDNGTFEIRFDDFVERRTVLNEPSVILEQSNDTTVAIVVDPTLTFTVGSHAGACNGVSQTAGSSTSGTAVNLGRVTSSANVFAAQDLTVSTNAANGYTVFARYNGTMTDGASHNITDWTGTNASPTATWAAGNTYFGYTVDDSTLSGTANRFTNGGAKFAAMTTTNSEVHYAAGTVSNDANCVGYQVGISAAVPAGSYSTTVIYTAVPLF